MSAVAGDPRGRLLLPTRIVACLFDLDGVLTQTASVHGAAWKEMFDAYLREREERGDGPYGPFDLALDYREHVDGRHREDGVRAFLASRDIVLPEGTPADPPEAETVWGLGNRKNVLVLAILRERGVEPFEGSVRFLHAVRAAGLATAVVSASANCEAVLAAAGLTGHFAVVVDGNVARRDGLRGKPAPDTYLAAAERLGVEPAAAAVLEDALAGVEAGRAGGFGLVVGVDRGAGPDALRAHGADVVVADLAELLREGA